MSLGSGAAFGAMTVFGTLAYDEGATVGTRRSSPQRRSLLVASASIVAASPRSRSRRAASRSSWPATARGRSIPCAALGLGAAVVYSTYILVSEGVAARMRPTVLSALVSTGAAASLIAGTALLGQFQPGELTAAGWGWLACFAVSPPWPPSACSSPACVGSGRQPPRSSPRWSRS
jgi:hypothetical protein